MTTPEQRLLILSLVDEAIHAGARLKACCRTIGMHPRTLTRWRREPSGRGDGRPWAIRPQPANALTPEEKAAIITLVNEPANADKPPAQIVPQLADQGQYLASESSFYRVMREHDQINHRGRARAPRRQPKPVHIATGPNQVWVWDITYVKSSISGIFFYLYVIMDLYSRKIVAHEVYENENAANSATLLRRAAWSEKIAVAQHPLVLHGDNGSPLKAGTVLSLMHSLGITPSHSRPRVSNDNAHAEAVFRTAKYHPTLDSNGFANLTLAQQWALKFVQWYNHEHLHCSLRFVTPEQKHRGEDLEILTKRKDLYELAKALNPRRWSQNRTRNWEPTTHSALTPVDEREIEKILKKSA